MHSFKHSGDVGDILYSLPAMELLGGGILYLSQSPETRALMTAQRIRALAPLLEQQTMVKRVACHTGQAVRHDLDRFRFAGGSNLVQAHIAGQGCKEHWPRSAKWLRAEPKEIEPVVINATFRYRNRFFPWQQVVAAYKGRMIFLGLPDEHWEFEANYGPIPFYQAADFADMAGVIAGCELFIGNQSAAYAIAEGLKKRTIQEVCLNTPNCIFERPNAQYVFGSRVELPEI
ncbi:MAG TPA: hypothetical protein VEH27_11865 [Methylomirabilota bacterium]|nr:hypothetical protein [Methylomirabilota bacterium]